MLPNRLNPHQSLVLSLPTNPQQRPIGTAGGRNQATLFVTFSNAHNWYKYFLSLSTTIIINAITLYLVV